MNDIATQQQFVQLRSQGCSFASIADELKVSKPTLIKWSRKFQYEIQNLRAVELEALQQKWLSTLTARVDNLGQQLRALESELAKRDPASLSTAQLYSLADALRRQILRDTGQMRFTSTLREIPRDEYHDQVQDWIP